ncbi:MAG: hypothetical protein ACREJO_09120 [Phycisphaerales bacterium]
MAGCWSKWTCMMLVVVVAHLVAPARGQERIFTDDVAVKMSLRQAADKARQEHKVLIARLSITPPTQGRRPMWDNDTLRAWARWHAVVVDVSAEDAALLKATYGYDLPERKWQAYFFANDKRFKLFWPKLQPGDMLPSPFPDSRKMYKPGAQESFEQHWPTAIMAIHQFQLNLERAQAAMPVWDELHTRDNAPPAAPARRDIFREGDGLADPVTDPRDADRKAGRPAARVDVLARLEEARAAARDGNPRRAMGLYTWLWERGAEDEPAFNAVRLTAVLQEMKALSDLTQSSQKRVAKLIESELAQYPWGEFQDRYEYLRMVRELDNGDDVVTRLDIESNDPDEASMIPAEDFAALRLMTERLEVSPSQAVSRGWVEQQTKRLGRGRPARIPVDAWKSLIAFERWMIVHEAVRSYGIRLGSGDEKAAAELADAAILAAGDEPKAAANVRRSLGCIAAAAGQSRPNHAAWLAEAAKLDPSANERGPDPLADYIK